MIEGTYVKQQYKSSDQIHELGRVRFDASARAATRARGPSSPGMAGFWRPSIYRVRASADFAVCSAWTQPKLRSWTWD